MSSSQYSFCAERNFKPISISSGLDELKKHWETKAGLEFLMDNAFVVGSPDTVTEKINALFHACGGWGTLQVEAHDFYDDPAPWFHSLEPIAKEVAPRIELPGSKSAPPLAI